MPTLSLLQSSFSIIKCSHVTAPGYLQHSLLSLLHLFIICFKHLLTFINVCVLIAKCPSQVLQPAQALAGPLNPSYTCMSRKRHLPSDIFKIPGLKAPFCSRYAATHASKMLLVWAELHTDKISLGILAQMIFYGPSG